MTTSKKYWVEAKARSVAGILGKVNGTKKKDPTSRLSTHVGAAFEKPAADDRLIFVDINTPIEGGDKPDWIDKANKKLDQMERDTPDVKRAYIFVTNMDSKMGVDHSTIDSNNPLMWAHYADKHKGAVIEFSPNVSKDSVFSASKPVKYSDERPLLYRNADDMIKFSLSKNPEDAITEIVNNLVFTKSSEWGYEQEYRLLMPFLINDNQSFATLKFHPEELTAICLGCRMEEKDKSDVYNLAKSINPNVIIYSSLVSPRKFEIEYVEGL